MDVQTKYGSWIDRKNEKSKLAEIKRVPKKLVQNRLCNACFYRMSNLRRMHLKKLDKPSFHIENIGVDATVKLLNGIDACSSAGISEIP
jgi:hypothetical protein